MFNVDTRVLLGELSRSRAEKRTVHYLERGNVYMRVTRLTHSSDEGLLRLCADDGSEGAGLPLDDSVRVGDVSEDVVNLGRMKEDELAGFASAEDDVEEDEELIFDPILDCYYSPRTNTYFERQ